MVGIGEQLILGPSSGVKSRSAAASVIAVLKDLTAVLWVLSFLDRLDSAYPA